MISKNKSRVSPPETFVDITPNDATALSGFQWLRCAGAGNLVLQGAEQSSPITIAVAANEYVPFGAGYVMTATTATGIQGFA